MTTPADRFTRLEKVAVFLIALGDKRAREVLADLDLDTVEQLNDSIRGLGLVSAAEKASVMLEFAHFFCDGSPIVGNPAKEKRSGGKGAGAAMGDPAEPPPKPAPQGKKGRTVVDLGVSPIPPPSQGGPADAAPAEERPTHEEAAHDQSDEEQTILHTLEKLRERLDPSKIDWGRAGYDFGDGFKGPDESRRS